MTTTIETKTCPVCFEDFILNHPSKEYCSARCRERVKTRRRRDRERDKKYLQKHGQERINRGGTRIEDRPRDATPSLGSYSRGNIDILEILNRGFPIKPEEEN